MKSNTPTLTQSEEERAPWNDKWCHPEMFDEEEEDEWEEDDW